MHEPPQGFAPGVAGRASSVQKEGMVTSNEPGHYVADNYGIRIENLVFAKRIKNKIFFENLTLAPIERELINYNHLTNLEKNYLFKYHLDVYSKLSKYLSLKERKWLASFI